MSHERQIITFDKFFNKKTTGFIQTGRFFRILLYQQINTFFKFQNIPFQQETKTDNRPVKKINQTRNNPQTSVTEHSLIPGNHQQRNDLFLTVRIYY